jgi:GT2 family glycosyltransferase
MQKEQPLISIIILNYNSGELLLDCVESVFSSNYQNFEVIVVDNASTDNSHKICKKNFKKIKLIENVENLGYCEGNNIGIRNAKGDYIVILNPDTRVEPDWLEKFLDAIKKYGDGLFQGKNVAIDNEKILRSTGNMIHLFGFGSARDKGGIDTGQLKDVEEINYASGTCLFTSTAIMKKIGLFDPFLFLYHDDLDLGWRAACLNIKSFFVPSVKIKHVSSYSLQWSAKKFFWLERNRKYCLLTHYSLPTRKKMRLGLFIVDLMIFFFYLGKGMIKAKINADLEILKNRKIIQRRYRELEKIKTVPDKVLIEKFADTIFIPEDVSNELTGKLFNRILGLITRYTKKRLSFS